MEPQRWPLVMWSNTSSGAAVKGFCGHKVPNQIALKLGNGPRGADLIKELFKSRVLPEINKEKEKKKKAVSSGRSHKEKSEIRNVRDSAPGSVTWQRPENSLWELSELPGQPPAGTNGAPSLTTTRNWILPTNWRSLEVDRSLVEPPDEDATGRHLDSSLVRPKQRTQLKGIRNCSIISFLF